MGERGPVPKHSAQRRRANSPTPDHSPAAAEVEVPEPDPEWHSIASRWYESLAKSGQSVYYEPGDWMTAYLLAESMSRDLSPQFVGFAQTGRDQTEAEFAVIPLKGASLAAYLKGFAVLLVTEGDRRRVQLELQRGDGGDPDDEAAEATVTDIMSRLSAS